MTEQLEQPEDLQAPATKADVAELRTIVLELGQAVQALADMIGQAVEAEERPAAPTLEEQHRAFSARVKEG